MDLRYEFENIINDVENIGRWLLIRNFTNEHSEYWNDITKEAIGGPEYKYNDVLIRGYSAPAVSGISRKREGVVVLDPGDMDVTSEVFYFRYDTLVDLNDEIFELNWEGDGKPVLVYKKEDEGGKKVCPKRKYRIQKIERKRGDGGKVKYIQVFAEREMLR